MESSWTMATIVAVGAGALNNLVQLASPGRARQVAVAAAVGVVALGTGWLATTGEFLGSVVDAATWTFVAGAATGLLVAVTERFEPLRGSLADRRMAAMPDGDFARHVLVRIPLLTALAEELLFRGIVWRVLEDAGGPTVALLGSAAAFAVSHVVVGTEQARREDRPVGAWVAGTLVATLVAGLLLGALRSWTGGVLAPTGVHAAVNGVLAIGARRAARRG